MASQSDHIVILGAGHSGGRAAEALRQTGFAGKLTLLGAEDHPPYERPPLSKELLAGSIAVEKTYLKPRAWYEAAAIELRLGAAAVEIDRRANRLRLEDGATLPYDRLLLTTGARPRLLNAPGAAEAPLSYLRDITHSLALRAALESGKRLLVIGAGFIGLEAAAVARRLGAAVTVLEVADRPLARVAPPALGDFFAALHRRNGARIEIGCRVERVAGKAGGPVACITASGEAFEAEIVLVGIGAIPNVELAAAAGLAVEDGIVVDEYGRTADPDIFAAGDATSHFNPLLGRRLRLESWQNAQNQAIAVAKVMAGGTAPYAELPWFWSDQYDVNYQSIGAPLAWNELLWRGRPEDGRFSMLALQDGVPVGGATVNNAREMRFLKQLVARRRPIEPDRFQNPATKLDELCRG